MRAFYPAANSLKSDNQGFIENAHIRSYSVANGEGAV